MKISRLVLTITLVVLFLLLAILFGVLSWNYFYIGDPSWRSYLLACIPLVGVALITTAGCLRFIEAKETDTLRREIGGTALDDDSDTESNPDPEEQNQTESGGINQTNSGHQTSDSKANERDVSVKKKTDEKTQEKVEGSDSQTKSGNESKDDKDETVTTDSPKPRETKDNVGDKNP